MTKLINIIDSINIPPIINNHDKPFIIDMVSDFISFFIECDPLSFQNENFHQTLFSQVFSQSHLQISHLYNDDISIELKNIIERVIKKYFIYIIPQRSYSHSKVLYKPNIPFIQKKIDYLISIPQPDQRTKEWYLFRHKYLTASSIWKAFSTQSHINQLIYSKCLPIDVSKYEKVNLDSPLHWRQKYEELSILWYQNNFQTKIRDFGCIPHPTINYLAASPDGINVEPSSDRFGRMLEVKNIVNRDITGIPKFEYWIQMQIQMEVCNLNECDFLETRFIEYDSYNHFINDGSFNLSSDNKYKGICSLFMFENKPHYEYTPWNCNEEFYNHWNNQILIKNKHMNWIKNIYWKLDEISVVLVVRNKIWFNEAKLILDKLWKNILFDKKNGYLHRSPNKREKINPSTPSTKCLIDLNNTSSNLVFNIDTS